MAVPTHSDHGQSHRAVLEALSEGLLVHARTGEITLCNPAAERILETAAEQIVGTYHLGPMRRALRADGAAFTDDDHPAAVALRTGEAQHRVRMGLPRQDGAVRWLVVNAVPVRDEPTGAVVAAVTTFVDGTATEPIEKPVPTGQPPVTGEGAASPRISSRFLAHVSERLRAPLTDVLGTTDRLLETSMTDRQQQFLASIRSSGHALHAVIEDILAMSTLESDRFEPTRAPMSLHDVVHEAVCTVIDQAHEKGLELIVEVARNVPDQLRGDAHGYRQIVGKLLANAVAFTPAGEVVLRVQWNRDRTAVVTSVRDTGIGVAQGCGDAIFQASVAADETAACAGTGLGLAVCRALVERMGGAIGYRPANGGGSVFWLSMPVEPVAPGPERAVFALAGKQALVVEDNVHAGQHLCAILREWQLIPSLCTTGVQALAIVRAAAEDGQRWHFALIDTTLAEDDEWLTLATALAAEPGCEQMARILLGTTARPLPLDAVETAGVKRCLTKPISRAALLDALLADRGLQPARRGLSPAPDGPPVRALRVLLAEDNPTSAMAIAREFAGDGHQVTRVTTGGAAIAAWESQRFDVILMDVHLPVMDGLEATRRIRAEERRRGGHIPILALTASAVPEDEQRYRDAGVDGYLTRPIETAPVLAAMHDVAAQTRTI